MCLRVVVICAEHHTCVGGAVTATGRCSSVIWNSDRWHCYPRNIDIFCAGTATNQSGTDTIFTVPAQIFVAVTVSLFYCRCYSVTVLLSLLQCNVLSMFQSRCYIVSVVTVTVSLLYRIFVAVLMSLFHSLTAVTASLFQRCI